MSDEKPPEQNWRGWQTSFGFRALPLLLMAVLAVLLIVSLREAAPEIPYSQFKALVAEGAITEVRFRGASVEGTLKEPRTLEGGVSGTEFISWVPPVENETLLRDLEAAGVAVSAESAEASPLAVLFLYGLLPLVLVIGVLMWMQSRAQRRMAGEMGIDKAFKKYMKGTARTYEPDKALRVTFDDVAGAEHAKREVQEVVEFLKAPDKFLAIGAEIPRGVLLDGPPGTGKTLLARAVAGEADVPFLSLSASEFIEMFVGVGAARVRSLFEDAKKSAPAIVFIDEIDSIGRVRGTGLGGGHDEREQTLNQILSQMDGFESDDAVIVIAATNRPDVLDPALLRPGRFDRHVTLDLPDLRARRAILDVHAAGVTLEEKTDLDKVARATPGFSGADLRNLVNEAAIHAVRGGRGEVTQHDFDEARDKVIFGTERALVITPEEKRRLAVHEAGHTLVGWFQQDGDPVEKVTIIPRGRALGATHQLPENERYTFTERYIRGRLVVLLAGRAAEQEVTGEVSSGAEDDIKKATQLARRMVARWGMDRDIGPVDLAQSERHPFLGKEMAQSRRFSETTAHELDRAVKQILDDAGATAIAVIRKHAAAMLRLAETLEKKETLERNEIAAVLEGKQSKRLGDDLDAKPSVGSTDEEKARSAL